MRGRALISGPGLKVALLILAGLAAVGCEAGGVGAALPSLTGEWVAQRDPTRQFFVEADTFRFALVQTDSAVSGSWSATGATGVVVNPGQPAGGRVHGDQVEITFTYSQYDHGCVGPLSACSDLWYRFLGEFHGSSEVRGRVVGPPHPTLADPDLPSHAEWTLLRH